MNKVAIIAPHPDDETLGCGGTILKHIENGDQVFWIIVTSGKDNIIFKNVDLERYQNNIDSVAETYKFTEVVRLELPVVRLDTIPEYSIYESISGALRSIKPNIVYMPNLNDVHSDHQIIARIMISCTKNFRFPYIERIYMYETISETDYAAPLQNHAFVPNYFVDITDYFERKVNIMQLYTTEIMPEPSPRSVHAITGLAAFRGGRISALYAEAFVLLFEKA
jgi:N-acetylglucosamine malate deacetylase 1